MKYNSLAVVLPALLLSSTSYAVELYNKDGNTIDFYGYVMGDYHFSKKNDISTHGDQSNSRFGIKGTTEINPELKGFGHFEYNQPINNNENSFWGEEGEVRLGYAGLTHDTYGTIQYGHNWSVMYDVTQYADMLPEFGEDTLGYFSEVSGSTVIDPDSMFGSGRGNGMLQYRYSYAGFDMGLQYLASSTGVQGEGAGASLQYTFDSVGITLGGAYNAGSKDMQAIRNLENPNGGVTLAPDFNESRAHMWALGAKYDLNNIYLSAVYAETNNQQPYVDINNNNNFADKTQAYFLTAQYTFDMGLTPGIAYAQGKAKSLNGYGDQDYSKYVDLSLNYAINNHFTTYVDYKINLLDNNEYTRQNSVLTDDVVAVAFQYNF